MKHLLLGSSALVAAGLVAGSAEANVELGLGGYYTAAAGIDFSQDSASGEPGDNTSSDVFRQDVEVYFQGEVTLDNGLVVGATIQLEAQQSGDQIDEVWAYFRGSWGELRFGDDDDAYEQLAYLVPTASNIFGVDTPYFEFANNFGGGGAWAQTNNTIRELSGDATKIMYFSPSFGGFTFAASWAPDRRGEDTYSGFSGANGPGGTSFNNNAGQGDDIFAAAINFEHDFNGVNLVLGVGGGHANWEANAAGQDEDVWLGRAHAIISFAGFTVGVAGEYITNFQSSNVTGPDTWSAGVGVTYNWDAWTVGLAWSHGDYETFDNAHDADQLDIVAITGRYDLAPGISIDGMIGYNHYDSNTSNAGGFSSSNETWEAGIGFYIGF